MFTWLKEINNNNNSNNDNNNDNNNNNNNPNSITLISFGISDVLEHLLYIFIFFNFLHLIIKHLKIKK